MKKIYFDIDKIIFISIHGEKPALDVVWCEETVTTSFFGLFKEKQQKGFYRPFVSHPYTEEELKKNGYKVYSFDERLTERVVYKCYIIVNLEYNNSFTIEFETEKEMLEWVDNLKLKSSKTLEVVYEK